MLGDANISCSEANNSRGNYRQEREYNLKLGSVMSREREVGIGRHFKFRVLIVRQRGRGDKTYPFNNPRILLL